LETKRKRGIKGEIGEIKENVCRNQPGKVLVVYKRTIGKDKSKNESRGCG